MTRQRPIVPSSVRCAPINRIQKRTATVAPTLFFVRRMRMVRAREKYGVRVPPPHLDPAVAVVVVSVLLWVAIALAIYSAWRAVR